jgi:hypothetical protein
VGSIISSFLLHFLLSFFLPHYRMQIWQMLQTLCWPCKSRELR